MVLGRQIDIHVDEIICQMLRQGIFGFLLVAIVLSEGLEILDVVSTDTESQKKLLTLQGTLCSVKKSAVPEVAKML